MDNSQIISSPAPHIPSLQLPQLEEPWGSISADPTDGLLLPSTLSYHTQHSHSSHLSHYSHHSFHNETSFVLELQYSTEAFSTEELVLMFMFGVNSLLYFYYNRYIVKVILLQSCIAVFDGLLLWILGVKFTTIPYILVILATLYAIVSVPNLVEMRQLMLIPLLYLLGLKGIGYKLATLWKVLKKESFWMFLSVAFLLYSFGFVSYCIFWKNGQHFSSPIHASITLLQISTFDSIGKIISRTSVTSSLVTSFGVLVTTVLIFQILYNINQALILQYIHVKKFSNHLGELLLPTFKDIGIDLDPKGNVFRQINILCTTIGFIFPFQSHLTWVYYTLSVISTLCVILFEASSGDIFGKLPATTVFLQVLITFSLIYEYREATFLLYCARIFLIREVLNLWLKIKKVFKKIYPTLFLILVFFIMFVMLIVCLQADSFQNTFITGFQMLTLDDWSTHIKAYPWYMKIVLLLYLVIGSHILLNALVSQAFDELEDFRDQPRDSQSDKSNSLLESICHLSPERQFINIVKELKFEGFQRVENRCQ